MMLSKSFVTESRGIDHVQSYLHHGHTYNTVSGLPPRMNKCPEYLKSIHYRKECAEHSGESLGSLGFCAGLSEKTRYVQVWGRRRIKSLRLEKDISKCSVQLAYL